MDSGTMEFRRHSGHYAAIDLMKFIMSICVVAIHTGPLTNCENRVITQLYNCIVAYAVPFFFISAGFFLGRKFDHGGCAEDYHIAPILAYLKKIVSMYATWTVLYLPLTVIGFVKWNDSILSASVKFIRNLILVGENYNSWSLWYLLSTIYALVFVIVLLKKKVSVKTITFCGFLIISIGFFADQLVNYNGTLPAVLELLRKVIQVTVGNGRLFRGFFYIPLGILLATKQALPIQTGVVMFLSGFAVNFCLDGIVSDFAVLVSSVGLFLIVVQTNLPASPIYPKLRGISTDVYCLHLMVWSVYYAVVYGEKRYGFDCFAVTLVLSVLASHMLSLLRKRRMTGYSHRSVLKE